MVLDGLPPLAAGCTEEPGGRSKEAGRHHDKGTEKTAMYCDVVSLISRADWCWDSLEKQACRHAGDEAKTGATHRDIGEVIKYLKYFKKNCR
jgi:hypothetical protein